MGHQETIGEDARALLEKLGAWETYGATGWGKDGNESFLQSRSAVRHKTTTAKDTYDSKLSKYYTPELEAKVEAMFQEDYAAAEYGLTMRKINFDNSTAPS